MLELVAGVIEEGEKPEDVARREAEEESGAEVGEMEFIANYYCSAGGTTETTAVFYAQIDASGVSGVHGVEGENEDMRGKRQTNHTLTKLDIPRQQSLNLLNILRIG